MNTRKMYGNALISVLLLSLLVNFASAWHFTMGLTPNVTISTGDIRVFTGTINVFSGQGLSFTTYKADYNPPTIGYVWSQTDPSNSPAISVFCIPSNGIHSYTVSNTTYNSNDSVTVNQYCTLTAPTVNSIQTYKLTLTIDSVNQIIVNQNGNPAKGDNHTSCALISGSRSHETWNCFYPNYALTGTSSSASVYITVYPALKTTLYANRTFISADQKVQLWNVSVNGTGGTTRTPYSVSPSSGFVQTGNVFTFTSPGNYLITVKSSDNSGEKSNSSVTVVVTPPLTIGLTANRTFISAEQSVSFTNSTTGGTGNVVYTYSISPSSGFVQAGNKVSFNVAGNYVVTLNARDLSGETANAMVTVTVTPVLTANIIANRNYISADQNVTVSNTVTGGTGSNVYTYTVSPSTGYSKNGNVYTFTSPGNYIIRLNVSDLSGETANALVNIQVTPDLTTKLNVNTNLISAEQGVTVSNTTSGGTGSNVYSYTVSPSANVIRNGNKFNFTASGNYIITLNVSDLSGEKASSSVNVIVTPPLTANIIANRNYISADQNVTVSNTVTGGTGSVVYTYTVSPSTGYSKNGNVYTFTSPGNYIITLNVADLSGETANALVNIQVTPPLTTKLNVSTNLISAEQGVTVSNTTSGGTGSNVYTYKVSPDSGFSQNGNKFNFTAPGNYVITLNVSDLSGEKASSSVNVLVTPELTTKLDVSTNLISAEQGVTVSNTTSGGTGSNVYTYTVTPDTGVTQNGNSFNFSSAGNYTITLNVHDISGESANSVVNVTVTPPLTINVTANRTLISVHQPITFSNTTTGGTGNLTFYFTVNGGRQGPSFSFGEAGTFNVTEYVSDLSGETAQNTVIINVTPALNVTLTPNRILISAGQNVSFGNVTTGGTGNNNYTYQVFCDGAVQNGNVWQFNDAVPCEVQITVTDFSGEVATATANVTVTPQLTTQLNVSTNLISAGQGVTVSNVTSEGTGNNTYSYTVTPDSGVTQNGNSFNFSSAGNYTITLNVTDQSGEQASSSVNVNVTPVLETTLNVNTNLISADQGVTVSNVTVNGTGSNVYTTTVTPDTGVTQNGESYNFSVPGNYTITLNVSDLSGEQASSSVNVTVTPILTANLTANRTLISAEQWVSFANATTGGTGSNVYTFTITPDSYTVGANGTVQFNSPGTYNASFSVTDLSGEQANSGNITITVTPELTTALGANRTYISADQGVSVSNLTTGGTGSNNYTYTVSPNSGFTQNGNVFNFNTAGNYTITLNVSDLSEETANATVDINVTPALNVTLTPNRILISAGQNVSFGNVTTGGTGNNNYTYQVFCDGAVQNGNVWQFNDAVPCEVQITVTDFSGEVATATANVTVTPQLTTQLNVSTNLISAGQGVTVSNVTSEGTGNNTYSYTVTPDTGVTQNGNSFNFSSAGNYTITLNVTDQSGEQASSSVNVNVTPVLETTLNVNTNLISADQGVTVSNVTVNGTGSNVYTTTVTPDTGVTQNGESYNFSVPGNYTITLNVSDLSGEQASSSVNVTVTPILTANLTANRTLISAEQWVSFANATTGGTGSNVYTFTITPDSYTVGANGTVQFNSPGTYNASFSVTDLSGEQATSGNITITVTPELTTSFSANRSYISADQGVTVSNLTTGGTGSNNYTYTVSPDSGFTQNGNVFNFNTAGNYTITLNVSDLSGETANATVYINVTPALTTNVTVNRTLISADQGVNVSNVTTGGTGNVTYTYTVSPDTGVTQNGSVYNFSVPGNYVVTLNVSDATGETAGSQSATITVTPTISTTLFVSQKIISAGSNVLLTNDTVGGTGSNTYSYTFNSLVGVTLVGNKVTFGTAGSYLITLNVVDLSGETASSTNTVTVTAPTNPPCTVDCPSVNLTANVTYISADQWVSFTNTTTNFSHHKTYTYTVSPTNGFTEVGNKFEFTVPGNYNVELNVQGNTLEQMGSANVIITVTPVLTLTLDANFKYLSQGQTATVTNVVTGGTGDNMFSAYIITATNGSLISGVHESGNKFNFTAPGHYLLTQSVSDKSGEHATANVLFSITKPLSATIAPNKTTVNTGQKVSFKDTFVGGTPGGTLKHYYGYLVVNTATGYVITGNTITFTKPGVYQVHLHASDYSGETANSPAVTITVN